MNAYYPGTRVAFENALCTVRFNGVLPGHQGHWLGVEWDDTERGKHDGQYKGKRLFNTLSSSPTCASFIRATRVPDKTRTFLQALRFKYAEDGLEHTTLQPDASIEISGKVVEEVGFEKIRQQQAILHDLKIVILDGLRIRGDHDDAEKTEKIQSDIANTCPTIVELDLSRNLFEHWKEVAAVCAPLTKLRVLKARCV
jgi:tubulin-specific chaperone E